MLPQLPQNVLASIRQKEGGSILSGRGAGSTRSVGGRGAMIPITASQASMIMKNKQERMALQASGLEREFHIQPFQ